MPPHKKRHTKTNTSFISRTLEHDSIGGTRHNTTHILWVCVKFHKNNAFYFKLSYAINTFTSTAKMRNERAEAHTCPSQHLLGRTFSRRVLFYQSSRLREDRVGSVKQQSTTEVMPSPALAIIHIVLYYSLSSINSCKA